MKVSSKFFKIGKIGGVYYTSGLSRLRTMVIYGIGAPIPPDGGHLPDAEVILSFGVDIFVPDYIGFGRSDGIFTPNGCIRTFTKLFEDFTDGCVGNNFYSGKERVFRYKRVIFIGRSLGGAYVPLLPKYNSGIKELGIFCPAVDQADQGSVAGEETNEDFMKSMKLDGYHYLYRGVLDKVWWDHLENKDGLSPMDNIEYLSSARLFIAHGKKDKCIHYSKSVKYYNKIIKRFPESKKQFKLKLYEKGDHGSLTTSRACGDFLKWLGFGKKWLKGD